MDVRFRTPANFFICGQTQSGKSYLTRRILQNARELFDSASTKIIYCYGEYQKEFEELSPCVEMIEGFPDDIGSLTRGHENSLILLDFLMSQSSSDQRAVDLFTRGSHHMGVSVLYQTQNLFPPGKFVAHNQFEFTLHADLPESSRFIVCVNIGQADVS
jgi:hypothetical protein